MEETVIGVLDNKKKDDLINTICFFFKITREQFYSHKRDYDIIDARRVFIASAKKSLGIKEKDIALFLEIDRCTVSHHLKKHEDLIKTNEEYIGKYKECYADFEVYKEAEDLNYEVLRLESLKKAQESIVKSKEKLKKLKR